MRLPPNPFRRRKQLSIDGTVAGVQFNRSHAHVSAAGHQDLARQLRGSAPNEEYDPRWAIYESHDPSYDPYIQTGSLPIETRTPQPRFGTPRDLRAETEPAPIDYEQSVLLTQMAQARLQELAQEAESLGLDVRDQQMFHPGPSDASEPMEEAVPDEQALEQLMEAQPDYDALQMTHELFDQVMQEAIEAQQPEPPPEPMEDPYQQQMMYDEQMMDPYMMPGPGGMPGPG